MRGHRQLADMATPPARRAWRQPAPRPGQACATPLSPHAARTAGPPRGARALAVNPRESLSEAVSSTLPPVRSPCRTSLRCRYCSAAAISCSVCAAQGSGAGAGEGRPSHQAPDHCCASCAAAPPVPASRRQRNGAVATATPSQTPHPHLQHRDQVGLPVLAGGLREEGAALNRRQQRPAVAKLRHQPHLGRRLQGGRRGGVSAAQRRTSERQHTVSTHKSTPVPPQSCMQHRRTPPTLATALRDLLRSELFDSDEVRSSLSSGCTH